jgi:hypothetical protein
MGLMADLGGGPVGASPFRPKPSTDQLIAAEQRSAAAWRSFMV